MVERDVRPRGPYRLPPCGRDGVVRRHGSGLARALHHGEEPVLVHAWSVADAVRLRAAASSRAGALRGIERMRFALGLDHDLAPFHRRFARDRRLGPIIRRLPWLRPARRAEPFEALAWAVTEQLIEFERASAVQRRLVYRFGRASACRTLRDAPSAHTLAGRAPAELEACGVSARGSTALIRAAREVATGRADLDTHEPAWRRLATIPGIGAWTLECLGLHGQGRDDQLPAGDLAYLKLVGELAELGRRATEDEVRAFFAPYAPFAGIAGVHLLRGRRLGGGGSSRPGRRGDPGVQGLSLRAPVPAAARW